MTAEGATIPNTGGGAVSVGVQPTPALTHDRVASKNGPKAHVASENGSRDRGMNKTDLSVFHVPIRQAYSLPPGLGTCSVSFVSSNTVAAGFQKVTENDADLSAFHVPARPVSSLDDRAAARTNGALATGSRNATEDADTNLSAFQEAPASSSLPLGLADARAAIACVTTVATGSAWSSASETLSVVSSSSVLSHANVNAALNQLNTPSPPSSQKNCCLTCLFVSTAGKSEPPLRTAAGKPGRGLGGGGRSKKRGGEGSITSSSSSSCTSAVGRAGALAMALTTTFMAAYVPMAVYFVWASARDLPTQFPSESSTVYYMLLVNFVEGILRPFVYFWRVVGCKPAATACALCKRKTN